jgi:hypothetical protein
MACSGGIGWIRLGIQASSKVAGMSMALQKPGGEDGGQRTRCGGLLDTIRPRLYPSTDST